MFLELIPEGIAADPQDACSLRLIACGCFLLLSFSVRAQTPTLDSEEQTMLKLINDYRAQNGLNLLRASVDSAGDD